MNRNEILVLAAEFSEASNVDCFNAAFGPGSARLADVEVEVEEKGDRLQLQFAVEDEGIGLKVKVEAEGPALINGRSHADPNPLSVRFLNGMVANPAFTFSAMTEFRNVPTGTANLELDLDNGLLNLPGGSVQIVGVGANVTFHRWLEFFFKPE